MRRHFRLKDPPDFSDGEIRLEVIASDLEAKLETSYYKDHQK